MKTPNDERRVGSAINILEALEEMLRLDDSDPLCGQSKSLYDTVVRTLAEARAEHERAKKHDFRQLTNESETISGDD